MKRVAITGSNGFIGWHLRCYLGALQNIELICVQKEDFNSASDLATKICDADVIVHLAGLNVGDENDIEEVNVSLAQTLIQACNIANVKPHLIFSSSIHVDRDTAYGRSKRKASEVLQSWANGMGGKFCNMILPHVFGEHGQPFYNSAVATFAHQLSKKEKPKIHIDAELYLIHTQDLASEIYSIIKEGVVGDVRPEGYPLYVSELLERMSSMANHYIAGVIPDLHEEINLRLFNTLRSYLYPGQFPVSVIKHSDERGYLFEAVQSDNKGQAFVSITKPGITRGEHFHRFKFERFCVLKGVGRIRLRRLYGDEVRVYDVSGENPQYIDIPTLHTHNITNIGDQDLITLFWASEAFDPENADTFPETVE